MHCLVLGFKGNESRFLLCLPFSIVLAVTMIQNYVKRAQEAPWRSPHELATGQFERGREASTMMRMHWVCLISGFAVTLKQNHTLLASKGRLWPKSLKPKENQKGSERVPLPCHMALNGSTFCTGQTEKTLMRQHTVEMGACREEGSWRNWRNGGWVDMIKMYLIYK